MEEVLELCDKVKATVPVINFAHVHARENGGLREPKDFGALLDRTKDYVGNTFYTHFSGVEHEGGNEKDDHPDKEGRPEVRTIGGISSRVLSEHHGAISSSPLLEHDAMYMKVIYERVLTKKVAKETKVKKVEKLEKGEKREKGTRKSRKRRRYMPDLEEEREERAVKERPKPVKPSKDGVKKKPTKK